MLASLLWKKGGYLLLVDWGRVLRSHWERAFHALAPWMGSKTTSEAYVVRFPQPEENDLLLLWEEFLHRGISCRSLFSYWEGTMKGLILIASKTLWIFRGAFLRRKSSPSLTNCDLNKGVGQKGEFLSSWHLESPRCGWIRVISASHLSRLELPMVYSSLGRIWAMDYLGRLRLSVE